MPNHMPNPLAHDAGNGMHIHRWLEAKRSPVFLDPALDAMEEDELVREAIGDDLFGAFI
jgi:glutamine synthetase